MINIILFVILYVAALILIRIFKDKIPQTLRGVGTLATSIVLGCLVWSVIFLVTKASPDISGIPHMTALSFSSILPFELVNSSIINIIFR